MDLKDPEVFKEEVPRGRTGRRNGVEIYDIHEA
jgi:hypothetical protein